MSDFILFCDGLEAAGQIEYARRGRNVARKLLQAEKDLADARHALERVTADRDRWRDERFLEKHGQAWPK